MVGEIRDAETARIAVRAALTGVLVFSTMHANEASGAVSNLYNYGIPGFLVANSVAGVAAQRLVRKICPHCKQSYKPDKDLIKQMALPIRDTGGLKFSRGKGCQQCYHTGYYGRMGVFELMQIDLALREAIRRGTTGLGELRSLAVAAGMRPLVADAVDRMLSGDTSLDEALNVAAA